MGEDGHYPSAIYISTIENGHFTKAKNIGSPIEKNNYEQEIIGLSNNGENMLIYYSKKNGVGDIYLSELDKETNKFKAPVKLGMSINSSDKSEIAACISDDGNVIYFVSNKEGGLGGTDLYMSRKLPNGSWALAVNMGSEINTSFDEDFPNLSPDGKTLYFSSNGRPGMGGHDIFKITMDEASGKFTNAKNLGYPINTPDDDYNFRLSKNDRFGYIAASRPEGMGDMDIYRIQFNGVEPEYSVVIGDIKSSNPDVKVKLSTVVIRAFDAETEERVGKYLPNPYSGRYVMVLAPGKYKLTIEAEGFETIEEQITILDKSSFQFEITKDIILK